MMIMRWSFSNEFNSYYALVNLSSGIRTSLNLTSVTNLSML